MASAYSLRGSGDFRGNSATWRVLVKDAGDQAEALGAALAESPVTYGGLIRAEPDVSELGAGRYLVEFDYKPWTEGTPGTAGTTSPPEKAGQPVGTDLSFTFGGQTVKVFTSKETKFSAGRIDNPAPSFNQMIGYNPKDGSVEGCEVFAKSCDYSITKRYAGISYGYLATLFKNVATTNDAAFRGTAAGESLYIGADGSYRGSGSGGGGEGSLPWEITGKFKYSPNQSEDIEVGDITFPAGTIDGHDYQWFIFEDTTEDVGEGPYKVSRPKFGYVERVYDESDFTDLGMDD